MNRLFPTLAFALLCALATSLAVSWYLLDYPLFKANTAALQLSLESTADEIRPLLTDTPESQWDNKLRQTSYDFEFDIYWYSLDDFDLPIEDQALLLTSQRLITLETDETPVMEMLFPTQRIVLAIEPRAASRRFFNSAASVLAVLAICIIAATLVLIPVARRLQGLQGLANKYGSGNWSATNTDKSKDQIGQLGESMQDMASQIQQLIDNNNSLVQDQRELMQAVAHEFRAPMARMRFALEMNEDNTVDSSGSAEISNALDELNNMVSEVLQFARLQISAPDLQLNSVPLEQLLKECSDQCRHLFPSTVISADTDFSIRVNADPTHLQRALINLISNAAKYGQQRVNVSVEQSDSSITLHVDDDGFGIPERDRLRALKPFVRLETSRSRKLGGTGLGLAIANGVAIKHGGSLAITDSPIGGARLSLSLPVNGLN